MRIKVEKGHVSSVLQTVMHRVYISYLPSTIPIREQIREGCKIDVYGRVAHGHHKNFFVELLSGPHIVLHINFRFHHEHAVVMNSCSYGSWGSEVRHHNPLHHDDQFHLSIHVHESHYSISVNGHHLANYHHRYPPAAVQAIGFKGDVHLESATFEGFHFERDWNASHDYGHPGYNSYGTEDYIAPVFDASHEYNAYW